MAQAPKYFKPKRTPQPSTPNPYNWKWQQLRVDVLKANPICSVCLMALATEVDHVVPLSEGADLLDKNNLQSICRPCHKTKTLAERGGR